MRKYGLKTLALAIVIVFCLCVFVLGQFGGQYDYTSPSATVEPASIDGEMLFWDSSGWTCTEDTELFWDDVNKRFGIGTATPLELLQVEGNNAALRLQDDSGSWARIKVGNSQLTFAADPDNEVASTDIVFDMDGSEIARFMQGGNFGIGVATPDAKLEVNGYTMLGSDAPKIKMKKFTGTTHASTGGQTTMQTTGVTTDKIISVQVLVQDGSSTWYDASWGVRNAAHTFGYNIYNGFIYVQLGTSATSITSKPMKALVTYEE